MTKSLIRFLRGACRLTAFACVVSSAAAMFLFNPANRRSLVARAQWLQRTCRAALRALGVRSSDLGQRPQGAVIAANHLGYLDILVLGAMTPSVFVAKREVASWPVFGWFARMAGARFIDREKRGDVARVAQELAPAIESGLCVVLFLEGTSTDGKTVLPFKSSLLAPAAQSGWPVVPAALSYALPAGCSVEQEVCWWGEMTFLSHFINLASLPCINACVAWGSPVADVTDRKTLSVALHARVVALHRALVGCMPMARVPVVRADTLADVAS